MANQKFSGLPAVAAFVASLEWGVNDGGVSRKVSGAQLLAAVPQGTLGYAQIVANQAGLTNVAADITGLSVTVTAGTSRRLRISVVSLMQSATTDDILQVFIVDTSGPTNMQQGQSPAFAATPVSVLASVVVPGVTGTKTYKVQASRQGAGAASFIAGTGSPAYILVEDIGV